MRNSPLRKLSYRSGSSLFSLIAIILLVTACGGPPPPTPTPRPTVTPTPLSTPLPPVETVAPYGSSVRPYRMAVVTTDRAASGSKLADALSAKLGVTVEVDLISTEADALKQLCGDKPTAALLDGRSLLTALARACGTVAFKLMQNGRSGVKADLITRNSSVVANAGAQVQTIADLSGKDFCRLSGADQVSWALPALALRAAGLNPATDLKGIKEYGNFDQMLQAVADGVCGGAAIVSGTLPKYAVALPPGVSLRVLFTTPEFPFGGLVVSTLYPPGIAESLSAALRADPSALEALLGETKLTAATAADFADFTRFAQSAGLNLRASEP